MDGARELYIRNLDSKNGSPTLPIGRRLSRILKGVFGLSDAPREKSLSKEGWHASTMDAATFFLWSDESTPRLLGVLRSHVDDLLVAGGPEAWASLERLGTELGCVLREGTYCGKHISQDPVTGGRDLNFHEGVPSEPAANSHGSFSMARHGRSARAGRS